MKKIVFLLFLLFLKQLSAQQNNLIFKSRNLYLGQVEENLLPLNVSFAYVNKGKTNIKIISVRCYDDTKSLNWNKNNSITPGKQDKLTFSYSGKHLGVFNQKIFIRTNEPNTGEIELIFGGEVIPRQKNISDIFNIKNGAIGFAGNSIDFKEIKNTQKKTDTIFFMNLSNKVLAIENYELNPNFIQMQIPDNEIKPGNKGKIIITYIASLRNAFGITKDTVYFKTNEETNAVKEIYVKADISEDFSKIKPEKLKLAPKAYLINTNYDFKYVKKGEPVTTVFNIKNKGKTQLLIRKVDKSCECINVVYPEKIRFDRDSPIEITMNTKYLKGNIHETVTIITNDPENPRIVLHLMGIVD